MNRQALYEHYKDKKGYELAEEEQLINKEIESLVGKITALAEDISTTFVWQENYYTKIKALNDEISCKLKVRKELDNKLKVIEELSKIK